MYIGGGEENKEKRTAKEKPIEHGGKSWEDLTTVDI